jgi:hypothetical protein
MLIKKQNYVIDMRYTASPEKVSLDLTRHLPPRALMGPAAIITERPLVLLSVVKKRWSRLVYEAERQYASTLNRLKRKRIQEELARLRTYTFGANSLKGVDILFLASGQLLPDTTYPTIYLHMPEVTHLPYVISHLTVGGLLVVYPGSIDNQIIPLLL